MDAAGRLDFGVGYENNTCYPSAGLDHPLSGGVSETEILLAYGYVNFASKAGQLSGNHFLTLTSGLENLYPSAAGALEGQKDIRFDAPADANGDGGAGWSGHRPRRRKRGSSQARLARMSTIRSAAVNTCAKLR